MTNKHLIDQLIKHHENEMGTMLGDALRAAATALECADLDLASCDNRIEQLEAEQSYFITEMERLVFEAKARKAEQS